jgi:hypothetical protein
MPQTTAQILARQKASTPPPRPATQTAVAVAQPAPKTALVVPTNRTPLDTYLDEIAPSSFSGQLVKFNKDGKFVVTSTDAVIDENVDFIALCDEVLVGWIKFNGEGAPPDRIQGLLFDGFVMPARAALGDLDETKCRA